MTARVASRSALLLVTAVLALSSGCGSPVAQVGGRVEYEDGSPIQGAIKVVNFVPTDDSTAEVRKAGTGEIQDDGTFELRTRKPGDGVYKGKYAVTFTVLKDPRTGESLIDRQYNHKSRTPFTVEVTADKSDYLFQLKKL